MSKLRNDLILQKYLAWHDQTSELDLMKLVGITLWKVCHYLKDKFILVWTIAKYGRNNLKMVQCIQNVTMNYLQDQVRRWLI